METARLASETGDAAAAVVAVVAEVPAETWEVAVPAFPEGGEFGISEATTLGCFVDEPTVPVQPAVASSTPRAAKVRMDRVFMIAPGPADGW
jgi:hypothetical protein